MVRKKELSYMIIYYSDKDLDYIDILCSYIERKSYDVVKFFDIADYGEKTIIKLYDDVNEFWDFHKSLFHKVDENGNVFLGICGFSFRNTVYTLSLSEYRKTLHHEIADWMSLAKLIIHEFVHSVHAKVHDNTIMMWLTEGLAITLSEQCVNQKLFFQATLNQIVNGGVNYINYYAMFLYVIKKYGQKYVLNLILDENLLKRDTPKLYKETFAFYNKEKNTIS